MQITFQLIRGTTGYSDVCLWSECDHPYSIAFVREHAERTHTEKHGWKINKLFRKLYSCYGFETVTPFT